MYHFLYDLERVPLSCSIIWTIFGGSPLRPHYRPLFVALSVRIESSEYRMIQVYASRFDPELILYIRNSSKTQNIMQSDEVFEAGLEQKNEDSSVHVGGRRRFHNFALKSFSRICMILLDTSWGTTAGSWVQKFRLVRVVARAGKCTVLT